MKIETKTLKNGIRVAIVPVVGLRSVTVEVFLKIGSKYELKDEFGLSHFLEHMAFKGTKKRPSASDINREIDSKGATHNASTGQEYTSYYITTIEKNIPWAIELISDMLTNSVFDKDEVLKERGVIMEEIKMYHDNPIDGLSSEMAKFLYGKSKIGCWDVAGEVEDIKDVTRDKVVSYRNKLIMPKNIVVVVAGNVGSSAFDEVKKCFSEFDLGNGNVLPEVEVTLNPDKRKDIIKQVEQGHFAMAVPALKRNDPKKYAFKILNLILSGNSSAKLYQKIREDKGLAYYVFPISESFAEAGYWGVQSGVKKDKLGEAMEIVRSEICNVYNTLTLDELNLAKDCLLGRIELAMDRSDYWSELVGEKLVLDNEIVDLDDELEKYKKVTISEVAGLAEDIFKNEEIREVVIKNK